MTQTKKDIEKQALDCWGLDKATIEEKLNWGYKTELNYTYKFIIGKQISYQNKLYVVTNIEFDKYKRMLLVLDNGVKIKPTSADISLINPYSKNITSFNLNPARQFSALLKNGFLLDRNFYKQTYYKTREYRDKFEKSLEDSTGIVGIKAPIQSKQIREKIISTNKKKYDVDWFLNRGFHYGKISQSILNKFESEPKILSQVLGVSQLEIDIISTLLNEINFSDDLHYFAKNKDQFCFKLSNGKYKLVDFYDKKNNLVIEINGDFFHCNPKKYNEDYFNYFSNLTAKEIWILEKQILDDVKNLYGCKLYIIWESDWKENKNEIINNLKKILCNE